MNITYCNEKCDIGRVECDKFLTKNNSAFDAVIDFTLFINKCYETCPYKEVHSLIADE